MQEKDISRVFEMFVQLYEHLNSKGFVLKLNTGNLTEILEATLDSKFLKLFVAESENKVVGFINLNISKINIKFKAENSKYIGNISELFVDESCRSKNTGKMLIERAREYFSEYEIEYMQVHTMVKNTRAVNFYKNAGFTEDYISFIKLIND